MSVEALAAVVTVAVAVAGGCSTLLGHWLARRSASGRVSTSEAAVLWEQSQDMRAMLLTEKAKAEEQRDRLIEAYTTQVFPVLAEIRAAMDLLTRAVADGVRTVHEIQAAQGEATAHAVPETSPADP